MKVSALLLFSTIVGLQAQEPVTLPLSAANVHWGFFSKTVDPVLTVASGTEVTVEMVRPWGSPQDIYFFLLLLL